MSAKRLMLFLLVVLAVVAAFSLSPGLRQKVTGVFQAAKKEIGPGEGPATIGGDVKVYVPRGDEHYYHTRDCPLLKDVTAVPTPLGKARALDLTPCPECNPPG
jgi:hypothetical protein